MSRKVRLPHITLEKTLLIKMAGQDELRVTVPKESKVTFGPAIPGPAARDTYGGQREYAVRVYIGSTEKSGLLAVFTGVREFREDSVRVSKLIIRENGKAIWKSDEEGFEVTKSVKKTKHLLPDQF